MAIFRDIIAMGGSAGAVEGLIRLAPGLPASLAARVFVAVHVPATVSALPSILTRVGHLTARHPADHDVTEPGIIYVAPPDHHLLVKPGRVRVIRGPRENGHRPAIDPLFRSAAASYGARTICVVLSGNLDDGCAGASAVQAVGGMVVVEDPEECVFPSMPRAALRAAPTATVLPLAQIAPHLLALLATPIDETPDMIKRRSRGSPPDPDPVELDPPDLMALARSGVSSGLTCPDCHGGIFEVEVEGTQQYRCRVGHAFTADVLFSEQGASIEAALWTALRALEESAEMADRLRQRALQRGHDRAAHSYAQNCLTYQQRAQVIRSLLESGSGAGDGELSVGARPIQQ